jgi:putative hydrolase of the HAD superfamily
MLLSISRILKLKDKHLFFDLDRTLWDFDKNSTEALKHLFVEFDLNQKISDFDVFHDTYKRNNAQLWKAYGEGSIEKNHLRYERFRSTLIKFDIYDEMIINQISDGYVDLSPKLTHLFPNTLETLNALQQSHYNMHIITNGFKEVQHTKLSNARLSSYFDIVVCSEEVGKNKPSIEIYKHAMRLAGAKPESSVMIGDDFEVDVIGALRAGMFAIHFNPEVTISQKDNTTISCISELPGLLPSLFKLV